MDGGNENNWVAVPYRNIDPAVQVLCSAWPGPFEEFGERGRGRWQRGMNTRPRRNQGTARKTVPRRKHLQAARERILTPDGRLTEEEVARIREVVMALPLNGGGTTGNLAPAAAQE